MKRPAHSLEKIHDEPSAQLFLTLTKAAIGDCDSAVAGLSTAFATGENRRLAGLALAQCHVRAKRFSEAGLIITQVEQGP